MSKILIGRGDTDLDYPICRPSLDLDFTQEKLDPRITFTRGSTGTRVNRNRVIETVDANQPRFDYDPMTGECKGLLIEEGRYNDWIYSGQNVTTGWNTGGGTLSIDNTITAPDGTTNTIKFTENSLYKDGRNINQSISVTSGTSYTFSIFAKQPDNSPLRYFSILFWDTGFTTYQIVTFDPKNGTVLHNPDNKTIFIQKYPNGWWRFGVTSTATATVSCPFNIRFTNSLSSSANPPYGYGGPYGNYTGDGSSYLYFFGPQVENGAFMTSFIPTTTATVTRSADLASMTGTNFSSWFNQNEGTFYESTYKQTAPSGPGLRVMEISDGTNNNRTEIGYWFSGGLAGPYIYSSYSGPAQYQTYPSTTFPTSTKQAFSYSTFASNLTYVTSLSSSVSRYNKFLKPTYTSLGIGRGITSINQFGGTISRLTYYPRRLKNNQLQYLTQ